MINLAFPVQPGLYTIHAMNNGQVVFDLGGAKIRGTYTFVAESNMTVTPETANFIRVVPTGSPDEVGQAAQSLLALSDPIYLVIPKDDVRWRMLTRLEQFKMWEDNFSLDQSHWRRVNWRGLPFGEVDIYQLDAPDLVLFFERVMATWYLKK